MGRPKVVWSCGRHCSGRSFRGVRTIRGVDAWICHRNRTATGWRYRGGQGRGWWPARGSSRPRRSSGGRPPAGSGSSAGSRSSSRGRSSSGSGPSAGNGSPADGHRAPRRLGSSRPVCVAGGRRDRRRRGDRFRDRRFGCGLGRRAPGSRPVLVLYGSVQNPWVLGLLPLIPFPAGDVRRGPSFRAVEKTQKRPSGRTAFFRFDGRVSIAPACQCEKPLRIASVTFLASPNSIIVLSRKNSSFSTPA